MWSIFDSAWSSIWFCSICHLVFNILNVHFASFWTHRFQSLAEASWTLLQGMFNWTLVGTPFVVAPITYQVVTHLHWILHVGIGKYFPFHVGDSFSSNGASWSIILFSTALVCSMIFRNSETCFKCREEDNWVLVNSLVRLGALDSEIS